MPGVFSPTRLGDAWLLDGGLVNPVPVSLCRALGADIIIAVDVNSDLVGRRFVESDAATRGGPSGREMVDTILAQLPGGVRTQLAPLAASLLQPSPATPGYFEVLANAINIMQDHISRTRMAGEPPHVLLRPQLGEMRWMDFQQAGPAIAEGRACVERSVEALRRFFPAMPA